MNQNKRSGAFIQSKLNVLFYLAFPSLSESQDRISKQVIQLQDGCIIKIMEEQTKRQKQEMVEH